MIEVIPRSLAFALLIGCAGQESADTAGAPDAAETYAGEEDAPGGGLQGADADGSPGASGSAEFDAGSAGEAGEPYGPENSWWHADGGAVPAGLAGTGWDQGDVAHNFRLTDQLGDAVELYQFYGQVIVLDVFVGWCPTCVEMAPEGQAMWTDLSDEGVIYLSIMLEDLDHEAPDDADLAGWAASFGLTHPVLGGDVSRVWPYVEVGYPTMVVIGRDMTILADDLWPIDADKIRDEIREAGQ